MGTSVELLKALAVTAKLTGTMDLDEASVRVMAADLSAYPLPQILRALERCRREVKGRLTVADVVDRIEKLSMPPAFQLTSKVPAKPQTPEERAAFDRAMAEGLERCKAVLREAARRHAGEAEHPTMPRLLALSARALAGIEQGAKA